MPGLIVTLPRAVGSLAVVVMLLAITMSGVAQASPAARFAAEAWQANTGPADDGRVRVAQNFGQQIERSRRGEGDNGKPRQGAGAGAREGRRGAEQPNRQRPAPGSPAVAPQRRAAPVNPRRERVQQERRDFRRNVQEQRRELRQDRRDAQQDRRDARQDRRDARQDRRDVGRDVQQERRRVRRDVQQDRRDFRRNVQEQRRDFRRNVQEQRRDFRRNVQEERRDRRRGLRQERRDGPRTARPERRNIIQDRRDARRLRNTERRLDRRRTRAAPPTIIRSNRSQSIRRRALRRAGRDVFLTSRRYRPVDRVYRNRFRRGRSIYWLAPAAPAIALGTYIITSSDASYADYYDVFDDGPVIGIDRRYTLDEIIEDPTVRGKMRAVSLDNITFESGSARIASGAYEVLEDIADAMLEALDKNPDQLFLIEGHTDAVGDFEFNLALSEERATAVVEILVDEFDVPAKNLEAVGYGEEYLVIDTDGPDRRNRRVVIRPVGSLLARR